MNDEDLALEETLRTYAPPAPPDALREKVLQSARAERRRSRRRLIWRLSIAAAVLVAFVIGQSLEHAEIARCRGLLASCTSSRAERDVEELTVALAEMLNGGVLGPQIQRRLRAALRSEPHAVGIRALQRNRRWEFDLLGRE